MGHVRVIATDFSSKWENNDSKNDVINIRKIIYIYIYFNQLIFLPNGKTMIGKMM